MKDIFITVLDGASGCSHILALEMANKVLTQWLRALKYIHMLFSQKLDFGEQASTNCHVITFLALKALGFWVLSFKTTPARSQSNEIVEKLRKGFLENNTYASTSNPQTDKTQNEQYGICGPTQYRLAKARLG